MSDDSVILYLKDEFGITDGQQILKLSKEHRDAILAALIEDTPVSDSCNG